MKLTHLAVSNYRALRELSLPLSRFGCLIGRNNAGKSTVLQAIALFFSGTKLSKSDFFDESAPIRIAISFSGISQEDLDRLASEHREKIEKLILDGELTLVRYYGIDGKSRLRVACLTPKEQRFHDDAITAILKGKRKAAEIVSVVENAFPELKGTLDSTANQTKAKEAIQLLADSLPNDSKEMSEADLPTGIDSSISSLLPECIYIPAVKNLADDTKTAQTTPFGKILGILLEAVEPKLGDVAKLFHDLHTKFNRIVDSDGKVADNRLEEVKLIENTVQTFVRESFSDVSIELKIPPPELRALLSSAQIFVDDGVVGPIDTKGDGLRRAIVFAVLRSYVELNQPGAMSSGTSTARHDRHVLLFEEPEIYLHPSAQATLFDALRVFAERNHVVITTHSPAFFGPMATDNFVRISKRSDLSVAPRPFAVACRVNMDDVKEKDRFQLICFDNNNAAFFFDTVVLVEGDSDFIVIPHIAKVLCPQWDNAQTSLRFARIGGKASIRRYRQFFSRFGVSVVVITDLDILTRHFDQLEPTEELTNARSTMLQAVDKVIAQSASSEPGARQVKKAQDSGEVQILWRKARQMRQDMKDGKAKFEDLEKAVNDFFAWEVRNLQLEVLKAGTNEAVVAAKNKVIEMLRQQNVFVLEKGELESYYPDSVQGTDKPSKVSCFTDSGTNQALQQATPAGSGNGRVA